MFHKYAGQETNVPVGQAFSSLLLSDSRRGKVNSTKDTLFFYKQQVYKQVTSQVSEPISNGGSLRTHSILSISKWHDFRS